MPRKILRSQKNRENSTLQLKDRGTQARPFRTPKSQAPGNGHGIVVLAGRDDIVKTVLEGAGRYICDFEVRGYAERFKHTWSRPAGPSYRYVREESKGGLKNVNEQVWHSPSNAACTLLFRLCVASNALAVAAAEGGLLPLIFTRL